MERFTVIHSQAELLLPHINSPIEDFGRVQVMHTTGLKCSVSHSSCRCRPHGDFGCWMWMQAPAAREMEGERRENIQMSCRVVFSFLLFSPKLCAMVKRTRPPWQGTACRTVTSLLPMCQKTRQISACRTPTNARSDVSLITCK